jgi:UDP-glucose 4-epimerase
MVVPRLVEQALEDRPITVYGSGSQVRSFTWVGDVADALIKLVDTPAAVGQIFNLGHYEKITILELAQMIKELTQTSSSIQFVPYDVAYGRDFEDMMYRLPDISKIEKLIGYKPTKNLPEILQSVIEFYRSRTLEKVSSF